jgi:hypothetical protein
MTFMTTPYTFRQLLRAIFSAFLWILLGIPARAQQPALPSLADTLRAMPGVALDSVLVAPTAVDSKEWLLLNKDIQVELGGAVHNLYDFKFDKAEKQFRSLRRRYPNHPMPYFLLGLSTWWKIMPSNTYNEQYDKTFFAYLDTAITKAQVLYDADHNNYEASFFLSAAYGFDARLHAERRDWRKATVSSRRSLSYLQKSREANGLSPEFAFGEGLFNYYAVWIAEEYPWLRPVLLFFPKGNRETGLAQLRDVAQHGFYTGTEAQFFRMRILASERENKVEEAMAISRSLSKEYPDNACFARNFAMHCFTEGEFTDCERTSRDILDKLGKGLPGYEGFSGRVASYYLGYLMQTRYRDLTRAADYYRRCLVFSESVGQTSKGYYLFSLSNLGKIAALNHDVNQARRYYEQVLPRADHKSEMYKEARAYLRKNPSTAATLPAENLALSRR